MDDSKRALKGSPSRDLFKQAHKNLSKQFYSCDIDFVWVGKYPPRIIAFLDFKLPRDRVTFSEVLAYNDLLRIAPVYIVESPDPTTGPFKVYSYSGGDFRPNPPDVELEHIETCPDWLSFGKWERKVRSDGKGTTR